MDKVTVSSEALREVINAINGPGHHIRELQATRNLPLGLSSRKNPIDQLIEEFNVQVQEYNDSNAASTVQFGGRTYKRMTAKTINIGYGHKGVIILREIATGKIVVSVYDNLQPALKLIFRGFLGRQLKKALGENPLEQLEVFCAEEHYADFVKALPQNGLKPRARILSMQLKDQIEESLKDQLMFPKSSKHFLQARNQTIVHEALVEVTPRDQIASKHEVKLSLVDRIVANHLREVKRLKRLDQAKLF